MALVGAPPGFPEALDLPPDVHLDADPSSGRYDVVMSFAPDRAALARCFPGGAGLLDPYGGFWIAWPKQGSPLATEMREGDVRAAGLASGLVDNKICAVDEVWSGLRFVVRIEDRPPRR